MVLLAYLSLRFLAQLKKDFVMALRVSVGGLITRRIAYQALIFHTSEYFLNDAEKCSTLTMIILAMERQGGLIVRVFCSVGGVLSGAKYGKAAH